MILLSNFKSNDNRGLLDKKTHDLDSKIDLLKVNVKSLNSTKRTSKTNLSSNFYLNIGNLQLEDYNNQIEESKKSEIVNYKPSEIPNEDLIKIAERLTELEKIINEESAIKTHPKKTGKVISKKHFITKDDHKPGDTSSKFKEENFPIEQEEEDVSLNDLENIISKKIDMTIENYVTKTLLEESLNNIQLQIGCIPRSSSTEILEKAIKDLSKSVDDKGLEIEELKNIEKRIVKEHNEESKKLNEDIDECNNALKRLIDMINSLKLTSDDIEKNMNLRATSEEVFNLKLSMNE